VEWRRAYFQTHAPCEMCDFQSCEYQNKYYRKLRPTIKWIDLSDVLVPTVQSTSSGILRPRNFKAFRLVEYLSIIIEVCVRSTTVIFIKFCLSFSPFQLRPYISVFMYLPTTYIHTILRTIHSVTQVKTSWSIYIQRVSKEWSEFK